MKFEDNRSIAGDVGEVSGEFYLVTAERVPLRFSAQRAGFTGMLDPVAKKVPAASPTGGGSKLWKFRHSKPEKDFV